MGFEPGWVDHTTPMPERMLSPPLAQLLTQVVLVAISLTAAVNRKADCTKQLIGSNYDAEVEQCSGRVNPPRSQTLSRGDSTSRGLRS